MMRRGVQWNVLGHGMQHFVLRLGAIGFAIVSAMAVFWFYGHQITDPWWLWTYRAMTGCFIIMGYFAMRGLSHRIKEKRRKWSFALVVVLYLYVEVVCNLDHALVYYPLIRLEGLAAEVFAYVKLSVLAIMPVFGIALAFVDVDLLRERGSAPSLPTMPTSSPAMSKGSMGQGRPTPSVPQPKQAPAATLTGPAAGGPGPQAAYQPGASQGQKKPNELSDWWDVRKLQSLVGGSGKKGDTGSVNGQSNGAQTVQ